MKGLFDEGIGKGLVTYGEIAKSVRCLHCGELRDYLILGKPRIVELKCRACGKPFEYKMKEEVK